MKLALLALALLALSGCGRRIAGPAVDAHAAYHEAEDAYWTASPNGSEPEFWESQPERYGLPLHFSEMLRCECGDEIATPVRAARTVPKSRATVQ